MALKIMLDKLKYLAEIKSKDPNDPVTYADLAYLLQCVIDEERPSKKKFEPPTLQDVTAYCVQRDNGIDAAKFWNHYESNGWKVGRNPMKDWHAAIRTWERSLFAGGQKSSDSMFNQEEGRL